MADLKLKPLPPLTSVAGLGNIFKDVTDTIEAVKNDGKSLTEETGALRTDVNTVRTHIRKTHEDFHFQMGTLGNGGGGSSELQEKKSSESSEKQTITSDEVGNASGVLDVNR